MLGTKEWGGGGLGFSWPKQDVLNVPGDSLVGTLCWAGTTAEACLGPAFNQGTLLVLPSMLPWLRAPFLHYRTVKLVFRSCILHPASCADHLWHCCFPVSMSFSNLPGSGRTHRERTINITEVFKTSILCTCSQIQFEKLKKWDCRLWTTWILAENTNWIRRLGLITNMLFYKAHSLWEWYKISKIILTYTWNHSLFFTENISIPYW